VCMESESSRKDELLSMHKQSSSCELIPSST
jgi:hypothetical protein